MTTTRATEATDGASRHGRPGDTDAPAGTDAATTEAPVDTAGTTAESGGTEAPAGGECEATDSIKLQLQWVTQAQFAGYFAATDQGYFADRCLEVELIENPPDVTPQQQLADGSVDFAIAWVPEGTGRHGRRAPTS